MAEPTSATFDRELDEPCPDCNGRPITGRFVLLGQFQDPVAMRKQIMATGILDVRVSGTELHSLIDWDCSVEVCRKNKTYEVPPSERLAKRAQP